MPTLLAGKRHERVARARELHGRALAVVDKTTNLVALEAEDAFFKWQQARARVASLRKAFAAALQVADDASRAFKAGDIKPEVLISQQQTAVLTEAGINEALYQQALALIGLERITAGGFCTAWTAAPERR
jgi:outer membrane protein TolC